MAGSLDWLDTLTTQAGNVFGRAVEAAGAVATAKIELEAARAVMPDQTPVGGTSPLQTARPGFVLEPAHMLLGVGVVAAIGLVLILRKG